MNDKTKYLVGIISLTLFLIIAHLFVFVSRTNQSSVMDKNTLIVGMELKFPPFETVDETGSPIGVSVDLAEAIGEILEKDIRIKSVDYPSLIPALKSRNIDLILSSMTITQERLETISFSNEYAKSDLSLLMHQAREISSWEDLNTASSIVAVKQGTLGSAWAKKHLPKAHLKEFSEVATAMLDVNNGTSHAFIYDPLTLIEGSQNMSNTYLILDPLPNVKGWGIGMRQNDPKLENAINKALEQLKSEGFFDQMREKYLKEDVEKYESYGLDYFF